MKRALTGLAAVLVALSVNAAEKTLLEAAEAGDSAGALALLRERPDVNARGPDGTTAIMWASYNGDLELVKKLVAAGADVNAKNDFGAFALSEAAMTGSTPIIDALLESRRECGCREQRGRDGPDGSRAHGPTSMPRTCCSRPVPTSIRLSNGADNRR